MQTRFAVALAAALIISPVLVSSAFPAGGGGGSTTQQCPKGQVRDRNGKCVAPKQGMLDDDTLYENGAALAKAGRYDEAITVLGYIQNKADPRVLNYLGYAHRKSGRIQVGLGYYEEALRLNPNFVLTREYLGEAYLTLGDLASAKNQLNEIEKRCGKGCDEYTALASQIAQFNKT
ncbi:tetratricopeptide repeat protein [Mesorhizobium sp. BAC0120]|uniref:tetratricopeptide repeat protein n=1 Tax=Mesorhizobium sp. BAC0120 TaxID=3090670 RepID=UPI00298D3C04|nr:tetratricopeptide repeat protein [Mesorhizobium sp. BAC0120]MDW6022371.1 tetratricopeptide repeat protein [Mesorhizobium sp. BAC0120]